jgi:hypothetical protein
MGFRRVIGDVQVNKKLGKILPIKAFKLGPTQFQAEVERLRADGRMPTLSELLDVIAEVREVYAPQISAARRGKRK